MVETYYLIKVHGCTDPEIVATEETSEARNAIAKDMFKNTVSEEDCLFALDINDNGEPSVWPYSNEFVEEE